MRRRNLTEYEKIVIFEMWQDRIPTKVIALTLGVTYSCIHQQLKKRSLVG
jgi:predicted transcriptional regulator